jgi:hypothetical protein
MADEEPRLASVVFGRTLHADQWWRAVPAGITANGWLTDVVHAVVGGGLSLDEGPRFLLAGTSRYRLVGVACRASELSKKFNADPRPLFCFVGWLSDSTGHPVRLPALAELRAHYVEWAGPDYDRSIRDVWEADHDVASKPVRSVPAPAPWSRMLAPPDNAYYFTDGARHEDRADEILKAQPGYSVLCPVREQDGLWMAGLATADTFTLVTGWSRASDAALVDGGFVCAADVAERRSRAVATAPGARLSAAPPQQSSRPHDTEPEQHRRPRGEAERHAEPMQAQERQHRSRDFGVDLRLVRWFKTSTARFLRRTADWLDAESRENENPRWPAPRAAASNQAPESGGRAAADSEAGRRRATRNFGGFDT